MEIRMRSAVSRTAKGYSVEATLDMGTDTNASEVADINHVGSDDVTVAYLSAFQIAKLQAHMAALGAAFPREQE